MTYTIGIIIFIIVCILCSLHWMQKEISMLHRQQTTILYRLDGLTEGQGSLITALESVGVWIGSNGELNKSIVEDIVKLKQDASETKENVDDLNARMYNLGKK